MGWGHEKDLLRGGGGGGSQSIFACLFYFCMSLLQEEETIYSKKVQRSSYFNHNFELIFVNLCLEVKRATLLALFEISLHNYPKTLHYTLLHNFTTEWKWEHGVLSLNNEVGRISFKTIKIFWWCQKFAKI